jgi:serine/threonine-protein kinase
MTHPAEDDLLLRLLEFGAISLSDLREMEEELAHARTLVVGRDQGHGRISWLLQRGKIAPADLEAARAAGPRPEAPPRPALSPPPVPSGKGRYKVLNLLGEGGMGKVYKAHDRKLDRYVALKFLLASDPEMIKRFQREAQAQARLEHPGICRVYEVGEMDGRPFIAMQYIDGRTLKAARLEMTLEDKLQVVRAAAEAAHEAHRTGLIHRDLNPSNIMVERSETGAWVPYLMDFGLAREAAGPSLTQDGTAAGTPYYMSPEQAAGDIQKLDRRTDIYALGATLYELVSGSPPFEGTTVFDVLEKVVRAEPVPLRRRDPHIPVDLESIVMKCLEKEPQRRYDSARALAEDLGRYLDGDPVRARRAGPLYRLGKKAAKHKTAVGLAAAAVALLLAVAGLWLGERLSARERTALAQRFGREMQEVENILRLAHMLPLHDITPQIRQVEERMESIRSQMVVLGRPARGPGLYALGRGRLALDDPEAALESLRAAWEAGVREPDAAASLGRAYARVYQDRLPEAEAIRNPELREAKLKELEDRYRRPALEFLPLGAGATSEAPEYAKALLAMMGRRWQAALSFARQASERIPWLYEAHRLEGEIHAAVAAAAEREGRYDEAEAALAKAREALARALTVAPSDPALHLAEAELISGRMRMDESQGRPVEEAYRQTVEAVERALRADPGNAGAYDVLSYAEWFRGTALKRAGRDPEEAFRKAEAAARRALELEPGRTRALMRLGLSFVSRGEWEWETGTDAVPAFLEAQSRYEEAARREPGNVVVLNNLGNVHMLLGERARWSGGDPEPHLRKAIEVYQTALQISPGLSYLHSNLGNSWASIGEYWMDHGRDPEAELDEAERSHREAVRINPKYTRGWLNLAFDLADRARWAALSGRDPRPDLERALDACARAQELNPTAGNLHLTMANCHLDWAEWLFDHGENPTERLERARELLARSLELRATDAGAEASLGMTHHVAAGWAWARGLAPEADLAKAERAFTRAAAIDPSYGTASRERGSLWFDRALWGPPADRARLLQAAEADLRRAIEINKEDAIAHALLARVLLAGGGGGWKEAAALAERAKALNPLEPQGIIARAEVMAAGGDPGGGWTVLREALSRRPGSVKLLLASAAMGRGAPGSGEAADALLKMFPRHPQALALRRSPGTPR